MKKIIGAVALILFVLSAAGCGAFSAGTPGTEEEPELQEEVSAITEPQDPEPVISEEEVPASLPHEYREDQPVEKETSDDVAMEQEEAPGEETAEETATEPEGISEEETSVDTAADTEEVQEEETDTAEPEAPAEEYKHPEYPHGAAVMLDPGWEFADYSVIHTGAAVLYRAEGERKNIIVGVNAGHGTDGGGSEYTYCHPDYSPKVTGGSTAAGAVQAMAVSTGMTFFDGTAERDVNEQVAQILKEMLLQDGYDVLMIRDGEDVQLDNIARTVICNNVADCHIAIHFDGDGFDYDKGCFYMSVPDGIKGMYPVSEIWWEDDRLGECLIAGLTGAGALIFDNGSLPTDLTQTSYSTIPSVDIELGNAASDHSDEELYLRAAGLMEGIRLFFS